MVGPHFPGPRLLTVRYPSSGESRDRSPLRVARFNALKFLYFLSQQYLFPPNFPRVLSDSESNPRKSGLRRLDQSSLLPPTFFPSEPNAAHAVLRSAVGPPLEVRGPEEQSANNPTAPFPLFDLNLLLASPLFLLCSLVFNWSDPR